MIKSIPGSIALLLVFGSIHFAAAFDRQIHEVESGETLFSIAQQYDISVDNLLEWNDIEPTELAVGQQIYVEPEVEDAGEEHIHTVEAGETLFSISRMYGVEIGEIQQWNELDTETLYTGQELTVYTTREIEELPDDTIVDREDLATDPEDRTQIDFDELDVPDQEVQSTLHQHTVRRNDTVYRIAGMYQMTVDQLIELNDELESPEDLEVGQQLDVYRFISMPPDLTDTYDAGPQGAFFEYRLSETDSIEEILGHHHMDTHEFKALNPGMDIENLQEGDAVMLVTGGTSNNKNPYRSASTDGEKHLSIHTYSDEETGNTTTSGDLYNPDHLTAAHPYKSLGTIAYVENPLNGKGVFVLINDRTTGNQIKVSRAVKEALELPPADQPRQVLITGITN